MPEAGKEHNDYAFCGVCRLSHNQRRRHVYSQRHVARLKEVLSKAEAKLKEVRWMLAHPQPLIDQRTREANRYWCAFCEEEIQELDSTWACEQAIVHLTGESHSKRVKSFWVANGASVDRRDNFILTEDDLEKVRKAVFIIQALVLIWECKQWQKAKRRHEERKARSAMESKEALVTTDIPQQQQIDAAVGGLACNVHSVAGLSVLEQYTTPSGLHLAAAADPAAALQLSGVAQLKPTGFERVQQPARQCQAAASSSSYAVHTTVQLPSGESFVAIPRLSRLPGEGNIHTGAPAPWLAAGEQQTAAAGTGAGINRLSHTQSKRQARLRNPKRVGAEWADRRLAGMQAETGEKWLPNFGQVWQSGSRLETRRSFLSSDSLPGSSSMKAAATATGSMHGRVKLSSGANAQPLGQPRLQPSSSQVFVPPVLKRKEHPPEQRAALQPYVRKAKGEGRPQPE
eukprot:jgi/Chlat1/1620/Chrsp127S01884